MDAANHSGAVAVAVVIAADRETVWDAITNPDRWWPGVSLGAEVGGRFVELWSDAEGRPQATRGDVLAIEPGRILRLSWADYSWGDSTVVEWLVEPAEEGGTAVRLTHTGWDRLDGGEALRAAHDAGWRHHLENLRQYCEGSSG